MLKSLRGLVAVGLAAAAPAWAADPPSSAPAAANPYTIDPGTSSADLWKGFYVGGGVSASFAKGAKGAWGGEAFAGYDRAFDSGWTLGIRVDAGYEPWATAAGRLKGFDFAETDVKIGYPLGRITPWVVGGVALAKPTSLEGFDAANSVNALFSGPGALQAVGVAGVGVDYQITSNVRVGVGAYVNGGGAPLGR